MSLINIIFNEDVSVEGYKSNSVLVCFLNIIVLIHIPEHTRSLSGSLLGYKTIP